MRYVIKFVAAVTVLTTVTGCGSEKRVKQTPTQEYGEIKRVYVEKVMPQDAGVLVMFRYIDLPDEHHDSLLMTGPGRFPMEGEVWDLKVEEAGRWEWSSKKVSFDFSGNQSVPKPEKKVTPTSLTPAQYFASLNIWRGSPDVKVKTETVLDVGDQIHFQTSDGKWWKVGFERNSEGTYKYGVPELLNAPSPAAPPKR